MEPVKKKREKKGRWEESIRFNSCGEERDQCPCYIPFLQRHISALVSCSMWYTTQFVFDPITTVYFSPTTVSDVIRLCASQGWRCTTERWPSQIGAT
jgi:hypothetical protein